MALLSYANVGGPVMHPDNMPRQAACGLVVLQGLCVEKNCVMCP